MELGFSQMNFFLPLQEATLLIQVLCISTQEFAREVVGSKLEKRPLTRVEVVSKEIQ